MFNVPSTPPLTYFDLSIKQESRILSLNSLSEIREFSRYLYIRTVLKKRFRINYLYNIKKNINLVP